MASRIEDYALVGDGESCALIDRSGSVDWLCWPRFDSPACFAALLGTPDNGRWIIAPSNGTRMVKRRYVGDTLILETLFETESGTVAVVDFMPPRHATGDLVRMVQGRSGEVAMSMELVIRFGYGAIVPWVTQSHGDTTELRAIAGPDMLTPAHAGSRSRRRLTHRGRVCRESRARWRHFNSRTRHRICRRQMRSTNTMR